MKRQARSNVHFTVKHPLSLCVEQLQRTYGISLKRKPQQEEGSVKFVVYRWFFGYSGMAFHWTFFSQLKVKGELTENYIGITTVSLQVSHALGTWLLNAVGLLLFSPFIVAGITLIDLSTGIATLCLAGVPIFFFVFAPIIGTVRPKRRFLKEVALTLGYLLPSTKNQKAHPK